MEENQKNLAILRDFGARLRALRKKRGFTQISLAEKLGYKSSVPISNIENGETPINVLTLVKIAHLLDVDLHWLIMGTASDAVIRLKPFAIAHLAARQQDVMNLRNEEANLGIRESFGEFHGSRTDEIADQLETLRLYCQAVRKSLNEVLNDMGESI